MSLLRKFGNPVYPIFILLGIIFIVVGIYTDPAALTDDGYSLRWFWIVLGAFYELLIWGLILGFYLVFGRSRRRVERLKLAGVRTEAEIIAAEQTGTFINNNPVVDLTLKFRHADGNVHEVHHKEVIDLLNLNQVGVGAKVMILVSPTNPNDLTLA
ncbi:MAG: DUF3592 domain-containing protein [bacterium]